VDSDQNKQLVMRAYGLFGQGDIKGVVAMCTDDVCWLSADIAQVPFSGTFNGRFEVGEFFAGMEGSVDTLRFTPQDFIAEGDKVVVTGEARWQVKATGAQFESDWVHVFTLRDGQVKRFAQYTDTAAAADAFRAAPVVEQSGNTLRH
jgi:hypothetical protein